MSKSRGDRSTGVSLLRRALYLGPHTCPWWFGYTFDNPIRRLFHDPKAILGDYVAPGQTVVDIGCGLGYFSLALARLVGPGGRVIAVDIQSQMVNRAHRRACRQGLAERIDFRQCEQDRLGVDSPADFVLAFWMLHEVTDPKSLLEEVKSILRPHARFLIVEPIGHVSSGRFEETVQLALSVGYEISERPEIRFSRSVICSVPEN